MEQYVSQRRRSWTPLTQMDPVIHLSERHRSDMSLDLSGLTQKWRIKYQAFINNESDFDKVADALVIQNPRNHFRESGKGRKEKTKIRIDFEKEVNTAAIENLERVFATQTPTFIEDHDNGDDTVERAAVTRLTSGVTAEKRF